MNDGEVHVVQDPFGFWEVGTWRGHRVEVIRFGTERPSDRVVELAGRLCEMAHDSHARPDDPSTTSTNHEHEGAQP